jgi:LuxR family maltose regulon positive regulatory protein
LTLALLRACSALRLQQRAVALDAFQTAVSTTTQTSMLRPYLMVPRADVLELAGDDVEVSELLDRLDGRAGLLPEPQDGSGLSPREMQVLEVVATGASFAAVASRLFVSPNTVKSQMRDIYRKLNVRGRDHAVERARELGLLRR